MLSIARFLAWLTVTTLACLNLYLLWATPAWWIGLNAPCCLWLAYEARRASA